MFTPIADKAPLGEIADVEELIVALSPSVFVFMSATVVELVLVLAAFLFVVKLKVDPLFLRVEFSTTARK